MTERGAEGLASARRSTAVITQAQAAESLPVR